MIYVHRQYKFQAGDDLTRVANTTVLEDVGIGIATDR